MVVGLLIAFLITTGAMLLWHLRRRKAQAWPQGIEDTEAKRGPDGDLAESSSLEKPLKSATPPGDEGRQSPSKRPAALLSGISIRCLPCVGRFGGSGLGMVCRVWRRVPATKVAEFKTASMEMKPRFLSRFLPGLRFVKNLFLPRN